MKILVTGAAGFIGFHLCKKLANIGHEIIGIDNLNDYYDVSLKRARLAELGIEGDAHLTEQTCSRFLHSFNFFKIDITNKADLENLFKQEKIDIVCHLAAQAGVRYSIENPDAYIQSNIVGFTNILECCRNFNIKHLVYASSSSVYGMNSKIPFEETDRVDSPVSLYAATKKSNELMAYTYTHLYGFPTTGLRFFTVYGPWGRPDMSPMLFAEAILGGKPIKVFNNGDMERDFTYIDDIVEGIVRIVEKPVSDFRSKCEVYNIGNNASVKLADFISVIEKNIGKEAQKEMLPMQMGDVKKTWANVDKLMKDYDYNPSTNIEQGIKEFIEWYVCFYNKNEFKTHS